jgi:hypothetical protein
VRILLKLVASVFAWLILTLVVAAAIDISFGEPRPGLVSPIVLLPLVPVLYLIWRRGSSKSRTGGSNGFRTR